jgi:hypothetical protein
VALLCGFLVVGPAEENVHCLRARVRGDKLLWRSSVGGYRSRLFGPLAHYVTCLLAISFFFNFSFLLLLRLSAALLAACGEQKKGG